MAQSTKLRADDGEKMQGFSPWLNQRIEEWAQDRWNGQTSYVRMADFLTRGEGKDKCERCLKEGEWMVSDICARCHRWICNSCARLHYRLSAALCHDCYAQAYRTYQRADKRKTVAAGSTRDARGRFRRKVSE